MSNSTANATASGSTAAAAAPAQLDANIAGYIPLAQPKVGDTFFPIQGTP